MKDRTKAGKTAKAAGLTLMAVEYPSEYKLFADDKGPKVSDILKKGLFVSNCTEIKNENLFRKAS